jgi:hypothetical protein
MAGWNFIQTHYINNYNNQHHYTTNNINNNQHDYTYVHNNDQHHSYAYSRTK